jgi:hypothetical protein
MSQHNSGRPVNEPDDWPYGTPEQFPGYANPDTETPGNDTRPYEEWHHDGMLPADSGDWDAGQELEPPPEWPDAGTYVPGQDSQSSWDDGYRPAPHRPAGHRRRRRSPGRSIAVMALLLAAAAAIAVVAFSRNGVIHLSPTDNPRATATGGLGATIGEGRSRSAPPQPAITEAEANRVLSNYWRVNNEANEQRSSSLLGTIEADSSYAMDTGTYRFDRASNTSSNYVAFAPAHAAYYIPRQSVHAAYPHWFAVAVTDANLTSPHHPAGSGYLLFSQASPGATWKDVLKPDVVPGSGPAPHIATDAQGYATAVSPGSDATGLSIAPGQIASVTAAALDNSSTAVIKVPDNLTDEHDRDFWQSRLPAGSTDSDKHQPGPGPVFGLRTKDGGAILFYSLDAQLNLAPPPGETFRLEIPGYYSPSQTLTSAGVGYIEQFAAYDPPHGQADPHIAADTSSIASRD